VEVLVRERDDSISKDEEEDKEGETALVGLGLGDMIILKEKSSISWDRSTTKKQFRCLSISVVERDIDTSGQRKQFGN
jgi:hypothetical protein